jgi:hypothetical protein
LACATDVKGISKKISFMLEEMKEEVVMSEIEVGRKAFRKEIF